MGLVHLPTLSYIYHKIQPNVGKYTVRPMYHMYHVSYGFESPKHPLEA